MDRLESAVLNLNPVIDYEDRFPFITYTEFKRISNIKKRQSIISKNKILQTDTYNRTMGYIRGEMGEKEETYSLSLRRSPNKEYNVVYGVQTAIEELLSVPVEQHELDFAKEFYADQVNYGGISYFNAEMWQSVIDDHRGFLPIQIRAVKDGTVLKPKEPLLSVTGPGELAAVIEPVIMRVYFKSAVATEMHMIEQIIGDGRMIEIGKRSAPNEFMHLDAVEACIVGGGLNATSNDAASAVYPMLKTVGTTGHRFFASYNSEDEGFEAAVQKMDKIALLVDIVDSYKGIDKVLNIKKRYRNQNKSIFFRLDSGDILDQTLYALRLMKENNFMDPALDKIIIEDLSSIDQIKEIEMAVEKAGYDPKKFIIYGAGSLLVSKGKDRDKVSAGYKLINTEEGPTGKLSNDIDKQPVPGIPNIEIDLEKKERRIVQDSEEVNGTRLLDLVYNCGEFFFNNQGLEVITNARKRLFETFNWIGFKSVETGKTKEARQFVVNRLTGVLAA